MSEETKQEIKELDSSQTISKENFDTNNNETTQENLEIKNDESVNVDNMPHNNEKDEDSFVEKSENNDNVIIENNDLEKGQVNIEDYLDPSILDFKVVSKNDLQAYNEQDHLLDDLHDEYSNTFTDIKEKEVVVGTVVGLTDRDVLVDIGFKAEGIIHRTEFKDLPDPGDEIEVFIHTFEDRRGNIILSKERADFQKRWKEIRNCFEKEELITGVITRRIKGGMVVDLGVVQAFLPGSQLDIKPVTDFDEFLGVESEFKIVKFNELRENIVLSRKVILEGDLLEKRQAVLEDMEIGMILEGTVKNITDFGAFIDLGGIDGLLHITDITWGRINHPTEKLALGQKISVKVIDFDVEKVRVSLGMKQLQPEPWANIHDKYPIDSIVEGKIVNMMNYGVFIELEEGVEGLIHISEMSWTRHIKHPSDMFKVGDKLEAKILNIDHDDKKISLGIKQLTENPWDSIENKFKVGTDHSGIVRNLTQFGAFIELEEGVDGLVHVSDMSWTQLVRHPKDILKKGESVKVRIMDVSAEERRLSLGMKQTEENPWDMIRNDFPSGKVLNGTIIKVLEKGIIFKLNDDLEGIVPLKRLKKNEKEQLFSKYKEGDSHEVTVQEVDEEYKKIILIMDLGFEQNEEKFSTDEKLVKEENQEPEKIEIPKEIIEKISNDESESKD